MSAAIAVCEGCGHRRPVHPETDRCLACRDRAGTLGDPVRVAVDGSDGER